MGKRISVDAELEGVIRHATGDATLDASKLALFEARAVSTEAITQSGFYGGARIARGVLAEMEQYLKKGGTAVPMLIMHQGRMLPVGRVVQAKMFDLPNGETELRSLFYLPENKAEFISDIENAVIDEVSVGLATKHAFCSECQFDYFSESATWENFVTMTCNDGHEIGKDGVHVRLVGMQDWAELSLVGRGAAKDAKILSKEKQKLGQGGAQNKLAANGLPQHALMLNASFSMDNENKIQPQTKTKQEEKQMTDNNIVALSNSLASETAKSALLTKENEELKAGKTKAETDLAAANKKIEDLEAANKGNAALVAAKDKAEGDLKTLSEKLLPHAKAALTASGVAEDKLPATAIEMFAMIEEKGLKLHQIVGAGEGGKSRDDKDTKVEASTEAVKRNSFKLNKE